MNDQTEGGPQSEEWAGMRPADRGLTTPMVDDVFETLSNWRRRAICRYLATCDESGVDVTTLATAVARRGQSSAVAMDEIERDAVETELVETHLPKLHRIGILDFDERSGAVHYWGSPRVEKWAEHADAVADHNEF